MRTFDSNYEDWKVGDKVVWGDKRDICPLFTITEINVSARWAFWEDLGRSVIRQGSQWENIVRVTEIERDKTTMTDLEKLINDLLELPSIDLEGLEDTVEVRWQHGSHILLRITESGDDSYLDPAQVLLLLRWLKPQEEKLVALLEALQAKQVEDEATKEQREAERLNALKALHSDAVIAWQQGGCVGSCPSFEDIARKEQFIAVDLGGALESIPVTFVKQYPMLERMRKS